MTSRYGPLRRATLVGALVAGLVLSLSAPGIALGASVPKLPSTITPLVMAPAAVTNPTPIPVQGAGRVETAIAASQKFGTAQNVVLATGSDFPDALGGSGLAGAVKGPILLTRGTEVDAAILAEISRLGATKVYILGGYKAVSANAQTALTGAGLSVERLAGANRYDTAKLVADKTIALLGGTYTGGAFIATGNGYADALAAAPIMYAKGMPLVLVDAAGNYTLSAGMNTVNILGGTVAVPESVKTKLGAKAGTRLAGPGRYDTAIKVAEYGIGLEMSWNNLGIATGESFPDALCAGPLLGKNNSVLLMTQSASLTPVTSAKLSAVKAGVSQYYLFGGASVITPTTRAAIATALRTTTVTPPDPDPPLAGAHDLPDEFCTGSGCHNVLRNGNAADISTIHVNFSKEQFGCNFCHGIAGGPTASCEGCHKGTNAAHVAGHPAVASSSDDACTQAGCHGDGVVAEHINDEPGNDNDCTLCHNATTVITAGMTCEACHAPTEVQHASIPAHTVSGGGGCYDAMCHGTDVTKMHGIDFRLDGTTPPGCAACHGVGKTPSTTCLGACHQSSKFGVWHNNVGGHAALESAITTNSKACVSCHSSDLSDVAPGEHNGCSCHAFGHGAGADSCESCHPGPMDATQQYPYHVNAHDVIEDTIESNSAGCVSCHTKDLMNVAPGKHTGCSCHEYGYGGQGKNSCESCHADPMDPLAAHPYHVTSHDGWDETGGANSTSCVSCHGGNMLTVGTVPEHQHVKDAHAGCVCHAYDQYVGMEFALMGASTEDATECADCHKDNMAPHGFADGESVHHQNSWVAAGGHNTTTYSVNGATEDFSALLKGTDGNPVTGDWKFPTVNVFWSEDTTEAPAGAMVGLTATDVITCEDCHTGFSAAGPHGANDKWAIDPDFDADFAYAELTKKVDEYPSGIKIRKSLTAASVDPASPDFEGHEDGTVMTICSKCHDLQNVGTGTAFGTTNVGASNTAHASHHQDHKDGSAQCVNCHVAVPHGWKTPRLLVNGGWAGGANGIKAGHIEGDRAPYRSPDMLGTTAVNGSDMLINPATGYNDMGALTWPAAGPLKLENGAAVWDRYSCEGCGHQYHAVQERNVPLLTNTGAAYPDSTSNVRIITNNSNHMDDYDSTMVPPATP